LNTEFLKGAAKLAAINAKTIEEWNILILDKQIVAAQFFGLTGVSPLPKIKASIQINCIKVSADKICQGQRRPKARDCIKVWHTKHAVCMSLYLCPIVVIV
jgi:hypothetical protein